MGDDVEQLGPLGGVEPVAVAEQPQPLAAPVGRRARTPRRWSSWAQRSPEVRCRRDVVEARRRRARSQSISADRAIRRGRSRSAGRGRCGRSTSPPPGGAERAASAMRAGRRRRSRPARRASPQERAELGERRRRPPGTGARRRLALDEREHLSPALVEAERPAARRRSRPPRNGAGARGPPSVCGPTGRRTVSPTRTTTFSPTLTSPPTSGTSSSSPPPAASRHERSMRSSASCCSRRSFSASSIARIVCPIVSPG